LPTFVHVVPVNWATSRHCRSASQSAVTVQVSPAEDELLHAARVITRTVNTFRTMRHAISCRAFVVLQPQERHKTTRYWVAPQVLSVAQPWKHLKFAPSVAQLGSSVQTIVHCLPTTVQVVPLNWARSRHCRSTSQSVVAVHAAPAGSSDDVPHEPKAKKTANTGRMRSMRHAIRSPADRVLAVAGNTRPTRGIVRPCPRSRSASR
jgi:hypothetical protein